MKSIKLGFIMPILLIMGLATNTYAQIEIVNAFPNLSFSSPLDFQHAGDGSNMVYVVERAGRIERFENISSVSSSNTFLDIRDSVSTNGEGGLLGLAFHPNYDSNGNFYVYYTKEVPADSDSLTSVISRFKRNPLDPSVAEPDSELVLLEVGQPLTNHNAGQLAFGPDGYLYIALGDGGGSGDPFENGQDTATLLGSILRIDVDNTDPELNYAIPSDNPFVGMAGRDEIYAYGLRNPYRFSFDADNGALWVADVGQNRFEEIDLVEKGDNLGWNTVEGFECYPPMTTCDKTGLKDPVFVYSLSGSQSVTGGFIYRGSRLSELQGRYVYGDFISGDVWSFEWDGSSASDNQLIDSISMFDLVSFGQDQNNELYICSFDGNIYTFASTEDGNELEVAGTTSEDGWRFLGTPRTNEAYNSLLSGTWTQGSTGASTTAGDPNVLVWDETTRQFEAVSDLGQDIPNSQGFIAYMYEDDDPTTGGIQGGWPKTLTSSGTLKTGTVNFPISYTSPSAPDDTLAGFNLVSNPYPFSIDWEAASGWTKTNMEDAIYIWDPNANGGNGAYKQLVDGVGDDINLIAPFQAFFVQASGSGAALSVNETVREDGGVFLKEKNNTPIISLKLSREDFEDKTYITFKANADFKKDRKDALKLQSLSEEYLAFYTKTAESIALAVNSMPSNLTDTVQVPLFVETTKAGKYQMDWQLKDLPVGFDIIIEDLELGNLINLSTENRYSFNVTAAKSKVETRENSIPQTIKIKQAVSKPRFVVHIYPNGSNPGGDNTVIIPSQVVLEQNYPNPFNPNTVIRFGLPEASNVDIRIFNIIGQEVMRLVEGQRFNAGFHNVNFDASSLSSGIYIYQITTKGSATSKKMTIVK